MKEVIEVKGKAKNVFKYVEMMKKHKGNVTLGELSKNVKSIKVQLH
jgi:hypothetical protein